MTVEINIPIGVNEDACYFSQATGKLVHTKVVSFVASSAQANDVKTDSVTYMTKNGFSFVNVIEEPKITDLFPNEEAFYQFKNRID